MSPGRRDKGVVCAMAKCGVGGDFAAANVRVPGKRAQGFERKCLRHGVGWGVTVPAAGRRGWNGKWGCTERTRAHTHTHTDRWWPAGVCEGERRGLELVSDGVEGLKREEGKDDSKHGRMTHRAHDPLNPATVYNTVPPHVVHTYMYKREREREWYACSFFSFLPTTLFFKHFKRRGMSSRKNARADLEPFFYII